MTMATTGAVLSAVNNSLAVSCGKHSPNFTMRVKDLNTAGKAIYTESAQFALHFENVSPETNKLYVVSASVVGTTGGEETNGDGEANDEADGGTKSKASIPSGFLVRTQDEAVETREADETPEAAKTREAIATKKISIRVLTST